MSAVLTTAATAGVMPGTVSWGAAGADVQVVHQSAGFAAP
jgi:hypothetical protein